ncbi:MAG: lytic transglycosylase F [Rhodoblastus sp.]
MTRLRGSLLSPLAREGAKALRLSLVALAALFGGLTLATGDSAAAPAAKPWQLRPSTGDLDSMLKRRTVRLLVPYSKTLFFIDRGKELGVAAEFGRELETWLNKKHTTKTLRIHVAFVPTSRDQLVPDLIAGKGDAIAGNLTITDERRAQVDFAAPWMRQVKEIVVGGPAMPKVEKLDDLAGSTVHVRASSSYHEHLVKLNETLKAKGLKPITLAPTDENLEDEDLLEMVNAGLLPFAIVDDHKAQIWTKIYSGLVARPDLVLSEGGDIAWAIRKGSPQLKAELDKFFASHTSQTSFGATIKRRYYSDGNVVKNAYSDEAKARFKDLTALFAKYGKQFNFDPVLLIAQGFQESQLDQARRSPVGAVGLMQIKPATAAGKPIGITGVADNADRNVNAGVAYLRYLADTYVADAAVSPRNQTLLAFAAYNGGPGNLRKFREQARLMGLDPNVWFNNVEQGAAKVVGRETVQYVSNIYKYYVAYRLLWEEMQARDRAIAGDKPK